MPIAYHPKWWNGGWWNFYMSEDEKKEINQFLLSHVFNINNMEVLRNFATKT